MQVRELTIFMNILWKGLPKSFLAVKASTIKEQTVHARKNS